MSPAGATPGEWAHWDLTLGLGPDLLPVVCQPGLPIAPGSALSDYGKVPSRVLPNGSVIGVPKWTSHQTTDAELADWSTDPRLGICLQTRTVRAIDIDVTDADEVVGLMTWLRDFFLPWGDALPVRWRANSPKCLLLYQCPGDLPKAVLPVSHGMIEFLGTGQQCVIAGRHPSGVRYEWEAGLPLAIPVLTLEEDARLKEAMTSTFGTGPLTVSRSRRRSTSGEAPSVVTDAVTMYLQAHGLVCGVSADGRCDVLCPWVDTHTPGTGGTTSTSYFPAGTGGYETGAFVCLHAHCHDTTTGDFLTAIGYLDEGFDVLPAYEDPDDDLIGDDPDDLVGRPLTNGFDHDTGALLPPRPRLDLTADGTHIKATINNLYNWLSWRAQCGHWIRYDAFRDELVLATPHGPRPFTDSDYTRLCREAEAGLGGFLPISPDLIRRATHNVAQDAMFDSAQTWMAGLPDWDGVDRLSTFMAVYLGAHTSTPEESAYATAVGLYLWSAMAGRILAPGAQTDMVPILVSPQGTGKSSAVRAMAPSPLYYTEISLSDHDADRARLTRGKSLVELSELRGLHTKDLESIKAIVTRREDSWTPKYMEMSTTYRRRYVMVGTTNDDHFLSDPTGHRRWLPLRVGRQDIPAIQRDHAQLWAQARIVYLTSGILWREAQDRAVEFHDDFMFRDAWQDGIERYLADRIKAGIVNFVQIGQILENELDMKKGQWKRSDEMRVAAILRKLGWRPSKVYDGPTQIRAWVPSGCVLGHPQDTLL